MSERENAEEKLGNLGYRRIRNNKWTDGKRVVQVEHSSEYGRDRIRIWWKEDWRDYHAILFDYSRTGGPVCIVPVIELLRSSFVKEKRGQDSYANSGYWWSQNFPIDHELVRLVLNFKSRWDVLS